MQDLYATLKPQGELRFFFVFSPEKNSYFDLFY